MKKTCIALLCTLGVAACGGEERQAQSPQTTTTTSTTETTSSTPQQPYQQQQAAPTQTPSTAPTTQSPDMTSPRSYSAPDTTGGNMGPTGGTGTTGTDTTGTTDTTGLPGPSTSQQQGTTGTTSSDADNTKLNERDRKGTTKTPTDQGGGNDRKITAAIRRSVVADKALSFSAKNVKIITTGGKVTLRGTVKSEDEKSSIESKAKATPGVDSVDNQLDVKTK